MKKDYSFVIVLILGVMIGGLLTGYWAYDKNDLEDSYQTGYSEGYEEGKSDGKERGYKQGYNKGYADATEDGVATEKPDNKEFSDLLYKLIYGDLHDTPLSSCFSKVGYNSNSQILYLEFRTSKAVYEYKNVTEETYSDFINSDSLGTYFNREIKGKYDYERIR